MQCGVMRLSTYDLKFVQNIHYLMTQQKPITTNQVSLLEKLITKYAKQFKKQNLEIKVLQDLPWTNNIVSSDPLFTDAYISIENNKIIFKAPFNKNFIKEFRLTNNNSYIWFRENRRYESPFSTIAVKILVKLVHDFYPVVHYCPVISSLLNNIDQYNGVKYWEPTLVNVNGNHLIACTNEYLDYAIRHIDLNNHISTLSLISEYGIQIDSDIIEDKKKLDFVSSYITDVDMTNLSDVISYLKELKCDCIYFSGKSLLVKKDLQTKLIEVTTNLFNLNDMPYNRKIHDFNYPVVIQFSSTISTAKIQLHEIKKIIRIKDSTPINIR